MPWGGGGSKEEGGRKEGRKEGEKCHLLFPLPSLAHTGEERKEELPPSPAGITIDGRSTYMHYVDHSLLSSQCETCQKILAQVGKSSKWSHKESSSSSSSVLAPFLLGRGRYYYFSPGFYGREGWHICTGRRRAAASGGCGGCGGRRVSHPVPPPVDQSPPPPPPPPPTEAKPSSTHTDSGKGKSFSRELSRA